MASLDWSKCPAVESVPGRRSGAWVFKDTRMPVATVFENLEAGSDIEEIIEQFHGEVPKTMEELLTLPGVARKTAIRRPSVPPGPARRMRWRSPAN